MDKDQFEADVKKVKDGIDSEVEVAKTFSSVQWKAIGLIVVLCVAAVLMVTCSVSHAAEAPQTVLKDAVVPVNCEGDTCVLPKKAWEFTMRANAGLAQEVRDLRDQIKAAEDLKAKGCKGGRQS